MILLKEKGNLLRSGKKTSLFSKAIVLCLLIGTATSSLMAQTLTNYTLVPSSGTFTALAGATNPALSGGTVDDGYFNSIPIGFDFYYLGVRYTTLSASTNGWVSLGSTVANDQLTNNLSASAAPRPVLAPLWDDLNVVAATNVSYLTSGTSPNRTFTIQYVNTRWQYNAAAACIDFQIKLSEATGVITFVYRVLGGTLVAPSASVGITSTATGAGSFLSLNNFTNTATASSTVETTTINAKPLNNQTYTFTPPAPTAPSGLTFTNVGATTMTLNWTDNASNENSYLIYRSTNNINFTYYGEVPANSTTVAPTALTPSTTYYWRVFALAEGVSTALSGSQATVCAGPNTSQVPLTGLIARYKLDGNSSDDLNINPGIFQNGPTPTTDRFGIPNKAYLFDGSSQFMATTNTYNNPTNYSLSVWFNTTSTQGGRIAGFGDSRTGSSGNHDRMLWLDDDGKINFCVNPGGIGYVLSSVTSNYNDGAWHHVTATCSSVNGIKLYMDGILVASNASALGGQNFTGFWKMGWESGGWTPVSTNLFFTGALDDFLIYSKELTSTEVSSIYNNPDGAGSNSPVCTGGTLNLTSPAVAGTPTYSWTGPNGYTANTQNATVTNMSSAKEGTYTITTSVAGCATTSVSYTVAKINLALGPNISLTPQTNLLSRYRLDGNAADMKGVNPGVLQGSPTPTTGRFGIANMAYALDGNSQYISTTTQYTNPANFTVSIWFKTSTLTGGDLVSFGGNKTGFSGQHDRILYMNNAGQIYFGVYNGAVQVISSALTYNDDIWHHAAASLSSTNGIKLYMDGVLVSSNAAVTSAENFAGYWKFGSDNLGAWPSPPTSSYFNGSIDDILIYNAELTAPNVALLYSAPDGAASNSPVCNNGTLNLTVPTVASTTYSWSGPNSFSSATQNPSVTNMNTAKEGVYTVLATSGGCTATAYAIGKINRNLGPAISQVPTAGLLSKYYFDGNANDARNVNHGSLLNAPTLTTDRFGIANKAYAFNGSSQFMTTSVSYNNPTDLTLSLWFSTTTTTGGKLIGLGNSQTGGSGNYDRHIYMNNAGQIYFGVNPGAVTTINTTAAYNDGLWHHVVATVSTVSGIKLYVDGALIMSNATALGGENFAGYWKVGYDNLNAWPSAPASYYFNGSIDDVLIYNTTLSAANITTLYNSPDGAGHNGPVCVGSTLTFSATTVASTTYAWTGPNSFSSSTQNPTVTFSPTTAGTYTLTATSAGCTATAYAVTRYNTTTPGLWVGYADNSYTNASNWCGGLVPTATTDVTIPSVATLPTNTGTAYARNLTINNPATLTNASTGTITIYGNVTNNGTFTNQGTYLTAGTVIFNGSTAQSYGGTGTNTFNNLTLNNSNGLTLNRAATVNGITTLTLGAFTTNNNLTQNLYTGAIAGTGTGTTTGNIVFTKTIWGDRYHYLSSPIPGRTVADWNDNVTLKTGANANMYSYNETVADTNKLAGWTALTAVGNSLATLRGYAVFFPRWIYTTTVDVTGPYTHISSPSITLSNTPSTIPTTKPSSDGWQLVGNPYPSTIDWDAASGWTKTNIDGAIYMWDGRVNKYASYVGTTGTNGGSRYIGSMQGFFVRVNAVGATAGTLAMTNSVRTTSTLRDVWRTAENPVRSIRLKTTSADVDDETVIRFSDDATVNFDSQLDAYKLANSGTSPSLSSFSVTDEYSINSLPSNLDNKIIPLQLNTGLAGDYTFTAELTAFENGESVFLEDRLTETTINLLQQPTYTVSLNKAMYQGRFFLHYSKREATVTGTNNPVASNSIEIAAVQQNIFVLFPNQNSGDADIAVYDLLGKKVFSQSHVVITNGRIEVNLPEAQNGIYIVKVQSQVAAKTQQVLLQK